MEWSTAVGLGGISAAIIGMVIALVMLVNRAYQHGVEANLARAAQMDAQALKRQAETERDAALAAQVLAEGGREAALRQLETVREASRKLLKLHQDEIIKRINHANADEISALTAAVFGAPGPAGGDVPGVRPEGAVPATRGAGATAPGDDQGTATPVPD